MASRRVRPSPTQASLRPIAPISIGDRERVMLRLQVRQTGVVFGDGLQVDFVRTPRAADETVEYADQPDCGEFPVFCATDYPRSVPAAWRAQASLFIPIYPHEAMWMRFSSHGPVPTAMKIGIDGFNALTGGPWHERLMGKPQNYLVCPDQERLDGYGRRDGSLRQFTLTATNWEYGCRGKSADGFESTRIWLMAFAPRECSGSGSPASQPPCPARLAAARPTAVGGLATLCLDREAVTVRPDRYGIHTWDCLNYCALCVYLISDLAFRQITLRKAPPSAVPIHQDQDNLRIPHLSHNSRASQPGNRDRTRTRPDPWAHSPWQKPVH